jgi:hypothetical protein
MANSAILYQAEKDLQSQQRRQEQHIDIFVTSIIVAIFILLLFFVA